MEPAVQLQLIVDVTWHALHKFITLYHAADLSAWRLQAAETVCHAFPKHQWIDPDM